MNRSKSKKGHVAFKIDLEKTYDRLSWDFLKRGLLGFGFPLLSFLSLCGVPNLVPSVLFGVVLKLSLLALLEVILKYPICFLQMIFSYPLRPRSLNSR